MFIELLSIKINLLYGHVVANARSQPWQSNTLPRLHAHKLLI